MTKHPLPDLDADIRDHIERETQDNIERGASPEEARFAALRKFGNVTIIREDRRTGEAGSELSYPDFQDLRSARSFEDIAAHNALLPASIGLPRDPQRHWGALATANYFTVVKCEPTTSSGSAGITV